MVQQEPIGPHMADAIPIPAIKRGIQKTKQVVPVLLEFVTSKETEVSRPGTELRRLSGLTATKDGAGPEALGMG